MKEMDPPEFSCNLGSPKSKSKEDKQRFLRLRSPVPNLKRKVPNGYKETHVFRPEEPTYVPLFTNGKLHPAGAHVVGCMHQDSAIYYKIHWGGFSSRHDSVFLKEHCFHYYADCVSWVQSLTVEDSKSLRESIESTNRVLKSVAVQRLDRTRTPTAPNEISRDKVDSLIISPIIRQVEPRLDPPQQRYNGNLTNALEERGHTPQDMRDKYLMVADLMKERLIVAMELAAIRLGRNQSTPVISFEDMVDKEVIELKKEEISGYFPTEKLFWIQNEIMAPGSTQRLYCAICQLAETFCTRQTFGNHFRQKHDLFGKIYNCEYCQFEAKVPSILSRHLQIHHKDFIDGGDGSQKNHLLLPQFGGTNENYSICALLPTNGAIFPRNLLNAVQKLKLPRRKVKKLKVDPVTFSPVTVHTLCTAKPRLVNFDYTRFSFYQEFLKIFQAAADTCTTHFKFSRPLNKKELLITQWPVQSNAVQTVKSEKPGVGRPRNKTLPKHMVRNPGSNEKSAIPAIGHRKRKFCNISGD